jgi:hypothetical protein
MMERREWMMGMGEVGNSDGRLRLRCQQVVVVEEM